jgi:ketosteroid isomerase-like protein
VGFLAPDAVWEQAGGATLEGAAEIRKFAEDWSGAFDDFNIEIVDVLDFGNEVGLNVLDYKGRPNGSGYEVEMRLANVSVRDEGLIVRVVGYREIDEARAAAERLAQERADG